MRSSFFKNTMVAAVGSLCGLVFLLSCQSSEDQIRSVHALSAAQSKTVAGLVKRGEWDWQTFAKNPVGPASTVEDCKEFKEKIPSDWQQFTIHTPEDSNNPKGQMIEVFAYGKLDPKKPTVIFYNGGPASDSHSSYENLDAVPEAQDFSIVYMDQRGTGCSSAFPSSLEVGTLQRLRNYGTRGIVEDSEALRKKIMGEQGRWRIFGQSYGGMIVQRYLSMNSESVVSAHAHGLSLMSDSAEWLKLRLLSQKRVLKDYLGVYPTDAETLNQARSLIAETQCWSADELMVCGPGVLDSLTIYLGFKTSWKSLHRIIESLILPNGQLNLERLDWIAENLALGIYGANYQAGMVIGIIDQTAGRPPEFDTCRVPLEMLKQMGEAPESWTINECRVISKIQHKLWDPLLKEFIVTPNLPEELTPKSLLQSLIKKPRLPFFLYAGQLDVFVPVETFSEQVQVMGDYVQFESFANSGHEGFYTEKTVWKNLFK